jgi:hypothetical protein
MAIISVQGNIKAVNKAGFMVYFTHGNNRDHVNSSFARGKTILYLFRRRVQGFPAWTG